MIEKIKAGYSTGAVLALDAAEWPEIMIAMQIVMFGYDVAKSISVTEIQQSFGIEKRSAYRVYRILQEINEK